MFNHQDLNKLNDYAFGFLEVENSNGLLNKVLPQKEIVVSLIRQLSLQRGDNSIWNSIRTEYTIVNRWKSVRSLPVRSGGRVVRVPLK